MGSETKLEATRPMTPVELLVALSYAIDITPNGSTYHNWRTALVAEKIASNIAPNICKDVFYAGLLQDIGAVGLRKSLRDYDDYEEQKQDPQARNHPVKSAEMLNIFSGFRQVTQYILSHHERWDGNGYPYGRRGNEIRVGSQILAIVDKINFEDGFTSEFKLGFALKNFARETGCIWSQDIWEAVLNTTKDADFYKALFSTKELPKLIETKIDEIGYPDNLHDSDEIDKVLHVFSMVQDLKDPTTSGHAMRVAQLAKILTRRMGLSDDEIRMAYRAGLVSDIGKLGIPFEILSRTSRWNDMEKNVIKSHSRMTMKIFNCLPSCEEMCMFGDIVSHDHERWDGTGYPDNLKGEEIPLISRILSVVDAYDTMSSIVNYRIITPKGALMRIQAGAGSQFDPCVVDIMTEAFKENAFFEDYSAA
ncbi:MAG: HD domain-containing phosphohydrolase [Armatimonadota bacterium]